MPAILHSVASQFGTYTAVSPSQMARNARKSIALGGLAVVLIMGILVGVTFFFNKTGDFATASVVLPATVLQDTHAATLKGPSGHRVVSAAASMLTYAHTSSAISEYYIPTHITDIFAPAQTIYVTFMVDTHHQPGTLMIKWYKNGKLLTTDTLTHDPRSNVAFFSIHYQKASGAAELYWCTQRNCSDARLARVLTFNVVA
jgi:flagellar basal body-associated protein FliL